LPCGAVLGAVGCTKANFSGDAGGASDGGKKDAKTSDVAQPGTCAPGTVSASKGQAESCSCNAECQTGLFCADGLCCTSACGHRPARACNLPSSLGVCDFFPPGRKPTIPRSALPVRPADLWAGRNLRRQWRLPQVHGGTPCKAACDGDGITGFLTATAMASVLSRVSPPFCRLICDPAPAVAPIPARPIPSARLDSSAWLARCGRVSTALLPEQR